MTPQRAQREESFTLNCERDAGVLEGARLEGETQTEGVVRVQSPVEDGGDCSRDE